jgi:hypothetical protein
VLDGVEYPELYCPTAGLDANGYCTVACQAQDSTRNIFRHNKIYGQKGCAAVSCPGGNGINIQGGLEVPTATAAILWGGANEISHNVLKACAGSGIHFTHATTHNRINGNYLMGNGLGGIANGCGWDAGNYIFDNTLHGNYGAGIALNAAAKIKRNIVEDSRPVSEFNSEYQKLGYGTLPGHGIMTISGCSGEADDGGICAEYSGSELMDNTSVGNAGKDIVDPSGVAYGDRNLAQTTSGQAPYADTTLGPNGIFTYTGGAKLNCRADINHDCQVGAADNLILGTEWNYGTEECCGF